MVTVTADMWTGLSIGLLICGSPGLSEAIDCSDVFTASLKMIFPALSLDPRPQAPENGDA